MARRRVKPQRGWCIEGGNSPLTYDPSTATWVEDVMIPFIDISGDEGTTLQNEKSGWYFKRLIVWYTVTYDPVSVGNPQAIPVQVRVGVTPDDVTLQKNAVSGPMGLDFNEWSRVLQDDVVMAWEAAALVRDGSALTVDTTPVASSQTYPWPVQVHKMDLNVNIGLREDSSLLIAHGPWNGGAHVVATGDVFTLDWKIKALLQKRRD